MQTIKDLVLNSFSFNDIDDQEKETMINELADIAVQRSVVRALDKMTDDQTIEFEKTFNEDSKPGEIFKYLESNVPSFYDMLREEVLRLKDLAEEESN